MGMTLQQAKRCVAVLLAAFPHARVMEQTSVVYEEALIDLEFEIVDRAVRALILTELDFIPSIAKIRARAIEYRDGLKRAGGEAWGEVRKAVGRFGRERGDEAIASLDPLAGRVISALGWRDFCNSDDGDVSWRARFIDLYDKLAASDEHARKLAGAVEAPPERRALRAASMLELMPVSAPRVKR